MRCWLAYALGTVLLTSMLLAPPVAAADPSYTYTFATHAAFFSNETNQPAVIDPQVFVADPTVAAVTGPQNIMHIGGYRPARAASDQFSGLVPGGVYQLFRNQFTPQGPKRSPFGKPDAADSVFTASKDGTAVVTSVLPFCPDPTDGVLLSYHSDGTVHGPLGGEYGLNLHNQLLIRVAIALPSAMSVPMPTGSRTRFVRRLGDG